MDSEVYRIEKEEKGGYNEKKIGGKRGMKENEGNKEDKGLWD